MIAIAAAAIAVAAIAVGALLLRSDSAEQSALSAAIVDQLSLTAPNPSFAEEAGELLTNAGYEVDYVPGDETTVEFYRYLPARKYDIVLFRNHAARRPDVLAARLPDEAALFTSEAYDRNRYIEDQDSLRLVKVSYPGAEEVFFGIRSDFIVSRMEGDFGGALIVLMGCDGLTTDRTAAAFVAKGAGAVIGWDGLVTADHTDKATASLLRHLLIEGLTAEEAVEAAASEVGPDPAYGSTVKVVSVAAHSGGTPN
ncbi:MAG: hypothetical protein QME71_07755 [Dehalococcoidia bacterium]|nr:hypothetical protein [Dehalococcoidia bacterium]